ncbi:hypothetical protein [Streptomyces syringium]
MASAAQEDLRLRLRLRGGQARAPGTGPARSRRQSMAPGECPVMSDIRQ